MKHTFFRNVIRKNFVLNKFKKINKYITIKISKHILNISHCKFIAHAFHFHLQFFESFVFIGTLIISFEKGNDLD